MQLYKGFDKDLKCRGFQFEVGKEYEHKGGLKLCPGEQEVADGKGGFHACENPIDVLSYYTPSNSRYCAVELMEISEEREVNDSQRVGRGIKVGAEIGIKGIVDAFVRFTFQKIDPHSASTNTGYQSASTNTGNYSVATVEGEESIAIVTGYGSKARGALGCWLVITERGEWNGGIYPILCVKTARVDGEIIKADAFYALKNGEFVEVK